MLVQDGFDFNFNKNFYFIYLWNKLIACDLLIDSLYRLYIDANMNLNEQVMSVVGQKRFRDEINQKYLWHHRLSHIGEDRINKLKKEWDLWLFWFRVISNLWILFLRKNGQVTLYMTWKKCHQVICPSTHSCVWIVWCTDQGWL